MSFPNEKHREMWQNVLRFDTISSEESGEEEVEEVIYVKHIPWRSKRFNDFVTRLDTQAIYITEVCYGKEAVQAACAW